MLYSMVYIGLQVILNPEEQIKRMGQYESSKKNRLKRMALGLCRECSQKFKPGFRLCPKHLDYQRNYHKKLKEQLKDL